MSRTDLNDIHIVTHGYSSLLINVVALDDLWFPLLLLGTET